MRGTSPDVRVEIASVASESASGRWRCSGHVPRSVVVDGSVGIDDGKKSVACVLFASVVKVLLVVGGGGVDAVAEESAPLAVVMVADIDSDGRGTAASNASAVAVLHALAAADDVRGEGDAE